MDKSANTEMQSVLSEVFDKTAAYVFNWGISNQFKSCDYTLQLRNLTAGRESDVGIVSPYANFRIDPNSNFLNKEFKLDTSSTKSLLFHGEIEGGSYKFEYEETIQEKIKKVRFKKCVRNSLLEAAEMIGLELSRFKIKEQYIEIVKTKKMKKCAKCNPYLNELVQNAMEGRENAYYIYYMFAHGGAPDDSGRTSWPAHCIIICGKDEFSKILAFAKSHPHLVHALVYELCGNFATKGKIFNVRPSAPEFYKCDVPLKGSAQIIKDIDPLERKITDFKKNGVVANPPKDMLRNGK